MAITLSETANDIYPTSPCIALMRVYIDILFSPCGVAVVDILLRACH